MIYRKSTDLTPHSIEDWAALFDPSSINCDPLPKGITQEFIYAILMSQIHSDQDKLDQLKKDLLDESGMDALVIKRMEYMNYYDFDLFAAHLIASISRTPGEAVMYVWISAYILKALGRNYLTTQDVCEHICPFGQPKEDYMQQMWEMQKIDHNNMIINMLDSLQFGESLNLKTK